MRDDIVHITKYEFSFKNVQKLEIIQRKGPYLSQNYTDLWIASLCGDSYVTFFVNKSKSKDFAIGCAISREQFRDIISMPKQISIHEDSLFKKEDGAVRLFYDDDLHNVYDNLPKFIHKP